MNRGFDNGKIILSGHYSLSCSNCSTCHTDISHINVIVQNNLCQNQRMEIAHTGLYVPVDKTTLLLGTASPSLHNLCHVRAVIGPTLREDKCCEILLLPLSSGKIPSNELTKAEGILKNYLSLLVQNQHQSFNIKPVKLDEYKLPTGSNSQEIICLDDSPASKNQSLDPLPVSSHVTKIRSCSRSLLPAVQSTTISNTNDVEIIDLVGEVSSYAQLTCCCNSSKSVIVKSIVDCESLCEAPDRVEKINYYSVSSKKETGDSKADDDDVIICSEKECVSYRAENVVDEPLVNDSPVLLKDVSFVDLLSEDDSSKLLAKVPKKRLKGKVHNRRPKTKKKGVKINSLNCLLKHGSSDMVQSCCLNNNSTDYGSNNNMSSSSLLYRKNDNIDALMNDIAYSVKTLPTIEIGDNANGTNKNPVDDDKDEELSVVEVELSDHGIDEINLISENEDAEEDSRNNVENFNCEDYSSNINRMKINLKPGQKKEMNEWMKKKVIWGTVEGNMKTINTITNLPKEKLISTAKKRIPCIEPRLLKNLHKEELIKKGFVIDPLWGKKLQGRKNRVNLVNSENSESCSKTVISGSMPIASSSATVFAPEYTIKRSQAPTFIPINPSEASVSNVTSNSMWSRPAHLTLHQRTLMDCNSHRNQSTNCNRTDNSIALSGTPLIVRHFTSDSTLSRKRQSSSNNSPSKKCKVDSVGSNVCIPENCGEKNRTGLRPIVIDASNVAFSHGRNVDFSSKGLEICINYFKNQGHRVIAIVPNFRKGLIDDKNLSKWEKDGTLVFTPSRKVNGQLVVSHDDRYIIQCAAALEGVIVSQDHYRDFIGQNPLWDEAIKKRLLMFTWIDDLLMFPQDPLGRKGPSLDTFLRFSSQ